MANADTHSELNRLYWESDASVSQIAGRLDISRRALYDGIEPRPADRPCPECGGPLGFRNRTALEEGTAECAECGYETRVESPSAGPEPAETTPPPRERPRALADVGNAPALGSAFLTGLAMGAVVTFLVNRR